MASELATIAYRHIHGEMGGATVWMVRLPGGFLIDCGSAIYSEDRARLLVAAVNDGHADGFTDAGMEAAYRERNGL